MDLKKDFKELMIVAVVASVLVFLLNLDFFWKNIVFYFKDFRSPTIEQAINLDRQEEKLEPDTLYIETLDIKAPIQYVEQKDEKLFQAALQNGIVHYPGTALPGAAGNAYIFGHSSNDPWVKGDYDTIFAILPKIEIGAEVLISNFRGQVFKYMVTESLAARATDLHYLEQDLTQKILTLQTSYPIGTSLRRWIVRAELVE
jgi:sortase A